MSPSVEECLSPVWGAASRKAFWTTGCRASSKQYERTLEIQEGDSEKLKGHGKELRL